jgi:hypothetical protein
LIYLAAKLAAAEKSNADQEQLREKAEAEVKRLRNKVAARALTDAQLIDEVYAVDDVIDAGFGEGGGSPGEWWYERADELGCICGIDHSYGWRHHPYRGCFLRHDSQLLGRRRR